MLPNWNCRPSSYLPLSNLGAICMVNLRCIHHTALKWLLNLQDPSSRLIRWAVKLSEYDYVVEHRPGTKMRHADALSRSVNSIEKDMVLSREIIKEEQEKDEDCIRYKGDECFWVDEDGVLYR